VFAGVAQEIVFPAMCKKKRFFIKFDQDFAFFMNDFLVNC